MEELNKLYLNEISNVPSKNTAITTTAAFDLMPVLRIGQDSIRSRYMIST